MAERKSTKEDEKKNQELLEEWKGKFETDRTAKAEQDQDIDVYEEYYQGKRTFGNLRDAGQNQNRDPRTVVNFVRMVIEVLIDLSVPQPDLTAVSLDDEYALKLLNKYIRYVCRSGNLEEINMGNERRTKKFGGTFYKVHWDNAVKFGRYVGDIKISDPHPLHIIPNAGALNWEDDLEHYHHVLNKTEKYILRRWKRLTKEDLEDKAVLYTEYDQINDGNNKITVNGVTTYSSKSDTGLKRWSIIETTYLDDDGDICKLWWSGDLLIDHIKKFFWHRDESGEPTDFEILEPGTKVRVGIDEKGAPVLRPIEEVVVDEEYRITDEAGNLTGIKVDYYIPRCWDIVYQVYLPKDLSCWGTSMIDDIKDLYESILKAVYIQEESFLRGRKKIITDNDEDAKAIMDPGTEVVKVMGNVKEVDIGTNIDGLGWMEWLKAQMQLLTGATNAAMGVHDPGVKSGRQAQLYVSQANFKANLAATNKAIAFKKLYNIVANFAMAFCDDDRPFRLEGDNNKPEYGTFSRLSMLRDDSGNIIYPYWDINISCESGFMQNKTEVMNAIIQLASQRAFEPTPGNVAYLKVLQKLGMPYLEFIIKDLEEAIKRAEEMEKQKMAVAAAQQQQQPPQMTQQQMPIQPQQGAPAQGQKQLTPGEIIDGLPPQQKEVFFSLIKTDPKAAIMMLLEIMGGMQGGQGQQIAG